MTLCLIFYDLVHLEGAGAREEHEELYTPPRIVFITRRAGTGVGERFNDYDLVYPEGARATVDLEEMYTTPHIRDGTEVGERFKYHDLVLEGVVATAELEELYSISNRIKYTRWN